LGAILGCGEQIKLEIRAEKRKEEGMDDQSVKKKKKNSGNQAKDEGANQEMKDKRQGSGQSYKRKAKDQEMKR
jgi:hypothetical protein